MKFDRYIGVDYSGAGAPNSRQNGLQVMEAFPGRVAAYSADPHGTFDKYRWNRADVAEFLIERLGSGIPTIAGIDHGFSFPKSYFDKYQLGNWNDFLQDFERYWPTQNQSVNTLNVPSNKRRGEKSEFRVTENWSSSAKSVFEFGVPGQVAPSTHAGLPWLKKIRDCLGDKVHFWPFDGWSIEDGKSVLVEVYPAILKGRVRTTQSNEHKRDAEAAALWLRRIDDEGVLDHYLNPKLSVDETESAELEGWILGVM